MIELDHIYNMDCLEGMKQISDGVIDAVICDLPYGTTSNKWDSIIPFDKLWDEYKRICKPNAPIVLFGQEPFSSYLRLSNIKWYRYDWIWVKTRPTGHLNAKKQPLRKSENISVFYRHPCTYNPQGLIKGVFHNSRPSRSIPHNGKSYVGEEREFGPSEYTNYPCNLLEYSNGNRDSLHTAQKPVELIRYLIRTYTNEEDVVLDNCMGSGTTAVAAMRENRYFIGFEIDKGYYEKSLKRIEEEEQLIDHWTSNIEKIKD